MLNRILSIPLVLVCCVTAHSATSISDSPSIAANLGVVPASYCASSGCATGCAAVGCDSCQAGCDACQSGCQSCTSSCGGGLGCGLGSALGLGCSGGCANDCDKLFGFVAHSDKCFADFLSPMTNPVYFEDPRTLSEARFIFLHHKVPTAAGGGEIDLLALQL